MADQDKLLSDIKDSIANMQSSMQETYSELSDTKVTGKSKDGTVEITMFANYTFGDIDFDKNAMEGGVKEFKWRIREAWQNVTEQIQQATQEKTMALLQGMDVPPEIAQMTSDKDDDSGV